MMNKEEYKPMMEMEKAISLNTLFKKEIKDEYKALGNLLGWGDSYDQRSVVPGCKTIDASYIKTPLLEMKQDQPFGMIVATDGYEMGRGLQEFWEIVVKTNTHIILALNEEFAEGYSWGVQKYFPDEKNTTLKAGTLEITNLVDKIKKTNDSTMRFF